jgi:ADP-L-glycero-D-manno-heptose 6-epimerase
MRSYHQAYQINTNWQHHDRNIINSVDATNTPIHQKYLQQKIIVTGGAGFIGSNLVLELNRLGYQNIIIVDNLSRAEKFKNLTDLKILDYLDKNDFLNQLKENPAAYRDICAIFHQGACSDTMEHNGEYMMRNNFSYSKTLLDYALTYGIPFIYASSAAVYGNLLGFTETPIDEKPLNIYGYSKLLFDRYAMQKVNQLTPNSLVVGLRYFNVYGAREYHKQKMASVAFHHFTQYQENQQVKLFGAYENYGAGCHVRDFIYVKDIVNINLFFFEKALQGQLIQDVFNAGTGQAESFNQIAYAMLNAFDGHFANQNHLLEDLDSYIQSKKLLYIPFPDALKGKYQSYTQANIEKLKAVGYQKKFYTVLEGVQDYYQQLSQTLQTS